MRSFATTQHKRGAGPCPDKLRISISMSISNRAKNSHPCEAGREDWKLRGNSFPSPSTDLVYVPLDELQLLKPTYRRGYEKRAFAFKSGGRSATSFPPVKSLGGICDEKYVAYSFFRFGFPVPCFGSRHFAYIGS